MFYKFIIDPNTNKIVPISSHNGKKILNCYLNFLKNKRGGAKFLDNDLYNETYYNANWCNNEKFNQESRKGICVSDINYKENTCNFASLNSENKIINVQDKDIEYPIKTIKKNKLIKNIRDDETGTCISYDLNSKLWKVIVNNQIKLWNNEITTDESEIPNQIIPVEDYDINVGDMVRIIGTIYDGHIGTCKEFKLTRNIPRYGIKLDNGKRISLERKNIVLNNLPVPQIGSIVKIVRDGNYKNRIGIISSIDNDHQPGISVGARIRVDGVVSRPELNGQLGDVSSYDEEKNRYGVMLDNSKGNGILLKPECITVIKQKYSVKLYNNSIEDTNIRNLIPLDTFKKELINNDTFANTSTIISITRNNAKKREIKPSYVHLYGIKNTKYRIKRYPSNSQNMTLVEENDEGRDGLEKTIDLSKEKENFTEYIEWNEKSEIEADPIHNQISKDQYLSGVIDYAYYIIPNKDGSSKKILILDDQHTSYYQYPTNNINLPEFIDHYVRKCELNESCLDIILEDGWSRETKEPIRQLGGSTVGDKYLGEKNKIRNIKQWFNDVTKDEFSKFTNLLDKYINQYIKYCKENKHSDEQKKMKKLLSVNVKYQKNNKELKELERNKRILEIERDTYYKEKKLTEFKETADQYKLISDVVEKIRIDNKDIENELKSSLYDELYLLSSILVDRLSEYKGPKTNNISIIINRLRDCIKSSDFYLIDDIANTDNFYPGVLQMLRYKSLGWKNAKGVRIHNFDVSQIITRRGENKMNLTLVYQFFWRNILDTFVIPEKKTEVSKRITEIDEKFTKDDAWCIYLFFIGETGREEYKKGEEIMESMYDDCRELSTRSSLFTTDVEKKFYESYLTVEEIKDYTEKLNKQLDWIDTEEYFTKDCLINFMKNLIYNEIPVSDKIESILNNLFSYTEGFSIFDIRLLVTETYSISRMFRKFDRDKTRIPNCDNENSLKNIIYFGGGLHGYIVKQFLKSIFGIEPVSEPLLDITRPDKLHMNRYVKLTHGNFFFKNIGKTIISTPEFSTPELVILNPGTQIRVSGLLVRTDLNGKNAIIERFDEKQNRYKVKILDDNLEKGWLRHECAEVIPNHTVPIIIPEETRVSIRTNGEQGVVKSYDSDSDKYLVALDSGKNDQFNSDSITVLDISDGTRVKIRGVVAQPHLNNKFGIVGKYNDETGRYGVLLDQESNPKAFKGAKLEVIQFGGNYFN